MSKVAIDPPDVLALPTVTALATLRLGERAAQVQGLLDPLAVLAPGAPGVRARAARLEADLAALSGAALQHAQRYGDVEGPLRELLTLGSWLPDPHHLAVDLDEVGGVPVVARGGLLVPVGSSADPAVEAILARSMADDVHQPGRAVFVTEGWGRPPAWARTGGRALGVAGVGLTLWDSFAGQWESDRQLHPEHGTGPRIAKASAVAAVEGGGAVGSFVGSKAGKAAVTAVEKGAQALWHDVFG
ncbi:hypothetical protein GTQ99_19910 [Kineococcus sp. T13]|uniref:hypothetical protein n=1 Tax=Kineococcus vitellinus TaxID=2696565 RepID=UPI001413215E|nr:hypothetical protein [Kineococcus vitellinus]NAZ77658.1 hypothetical protein [Kineococcus vitellinus]